MFCKHEWKKESETTMGGLKEGTSLDGFGVGSLIRKLSKTTHVAIFQCKKCGKLKRFVTVHEIY